MNKRCIYFSTARLLSVFTKRKNSGGSNLYETEKKFFYIPSYVVCYNETNLAGRFSMSWVQLLSLNLSFLFKVWSSCASRSEVRAHNFKTILVSTTTDSTLFRGLYLSTQNFTKDLAASFAKSQRSKHEQILRKKTRNGLHSVYIYYKLAFKLFHVVDKQQAKQFSKYF